MNADHPVNSLKDDKLGFGDIAKNLAKVIVDKSSKNGLVLGVDGPWGSGKSTLLNFTKEILENEDPKQEVVTFEPWLIGDRNSLILNLFNELGNAVEKINGTENKKLNEEIKKFSSGLSGLANLAKLSGEPHAMLGGVILQGGKGAIDKFFESGSIYDQKQKISKELEKLERPIVVFVDDLDRLEPQEVLEIFRVIRAVANFPNIVYVLSFDAKNVAKTLEVALQIEDGNSYLEKIVQGVYRIPIPEFLDLKLWLEEEIKGLFGNEFLDKKSQIRFSSVLNHQARKYIKTPRDVIRVINALRMYGLPIKDKIDIVDMVWLQILRLGNSKFYDWVEKYLSRIASASGIIEISKQEKNNYSEELLSILVSEKVDLFFEKFELSNFICGIDTELEPLVESDERTIKVFCSLDNDLRNSLYAEKRLSSPQHFKTYFSFKNPIGALSNDDVQTFISLAERDKVRAQDLFMTYAREFRPQKNTKAELLIDCLISLRSNISGEAAYGIITCLAKCMDEIVFAYKNRSIGEYPGWEQSIVLFRFLLNKLSSNEKNELLNFVFSQGEALGWLSKIFRSEMFAHGHFGDEIIEEKRWLLSTEEFQVILDLMTKRFDRNAYKGFFSAPNSLMCFYAWKQARQDEHVNGMIQYWCLCPEFLIPFVEQFQGVSANSKGEFYFLETKATDEFISFEEVLKKLKVIIEDNQVSENLRKRAQKLLDATKKNVVQIDQD
ncbi:MAG: P-loop NTPase fold protein [Hyphomicrobiales bacterium]